VNRRIRNRTYGGVGAGAGDRSGYPIICTRRDAPRLVRAGYLDHFHEVIEAEARRSLARREFLERPQELADIILSWRQEIGPIEQPIEVRG